MRDIFFDLYYSLSLTDSARVVLSNDFGAPSLDKYRKDLPIQYINAGIAEQNIVSMAAGMALQGIKPLIYSIASFITARAFEQIKIDLCDMNLPVVIVGVGCGYGYSADGPTHHALEDIGLLSSLPNIKIYSPSGKQLLANLFPLIVDQKCPVYLRLDREITDEQVWPSTDVMSPIWGFRSIESGGRFAIISTSYMTQRVLDLKEKLDQLGLGGFDIYDIFEINAVLTERFISEICQYRGLFVIEEHVESNGLGSLVHLAVSNASLTVPVFRHSIPLSVAYGYGLRDTLLGRAGLDVSSLIGRIRTIINKNWGSAI